MTPNLPVKVGTLSESASLRLPLKESWVGRGRLRERRCNATLSCVRVWVCSATPVHPPRRQLQPTPSLLYVHVYGTVSVPLLVDISLNSLVFKGSLLIYLHCYKLNTSRHSNFKRIVESALVDRFVLFTTTRRGKNVKNSQLRLFLVLNNQPLSWSKSDIRYPLTIYVVRPLSTKYNTKLYD